MLEFALIDALARATAVRRRDVSLGIGDDGAILDVPRGQRLVVAMDTLVNGVHFPRGTDPADIGWKALAVNLSDLAAMGAQPAWATLALTLPRGDARWVAAFARGFARLAKRHDVALVGGDTTRGPLTITVQAHGFVPKRGALTRDGARVGDIVYVSGTLGDAAAGLAVAQGRLPTHSKRAKARGASSRRTAVSASLAKISDDSAHRFLRARLDRPTPRVALGVALRGIASAAIDVSDGFAQDLGHVLRASGVGARVYGDALPASRALLAVATSARQRRRWQLAGGDDYELCFTVPARHARRIAAIARSLRLPLTAIGRIIRGSGLDLRDADGRVIRLTRRGHEHFA